MNVQPAKLERLGENGLAIEWSDGRRLIYSARGLRDACPCATCREHAPSAASGFNPQTGAFTVLPIEETLPIQIMGMKPVGNYAYVISFSDGHSTGIYTFELLRELGQPAK